MLVPKVRLSILFIPSILYICERGRGRHHIYRNIENDPKIQGRKRGRSRHPRKSLRCCAAPHGLLHHVQESGGGKENDGERQREDLTILICGRELEGRELFYKDVQEERQPALEFGEDAQRRKEAKLLVNWLDCRGATPCWIRASASKAAADFRVAYA